MPFYPFFGGGLPYQNRLQKEGYPYSNLSTGGPSFEHPPYPHFAFRIASKDATSAKDTGQRSRAAPRIQGKTNSPRNTDTQALKNISLNNALKSTQHVFARLFYGTGGFGGVHCVFA